MVVHMPVDGWQMGASFGHWDEVVHSTQVLVVVSQIAIPEGHCEFSRQATQRPELAPVVAQIVERQSTVPSVDVQGPSPLA
jgi:hypothetical protein